MLKKQGFSIIEFIVVIIILGILSGVGINFMLEVGRARLFQWQRKEISESAKIAIDRMSREIRRINSKTSVYTATSSAFRFIDIDSSDVTYDLSGSSLRRNQGGTINVLADNVSALTFTYYNSSGAAIVIPVVNPGQTDIRMIQIDINFTYNDQQFKIRSQVTPRRLQL